MANNKRFTETAVLGKSAACTGRAASARGGGYAERAKLFLPFDALKGFREALAEKERIVVPRIELSEEMAEELDRTLKQIRPGDMITVIYYHHEEYVKQCGLVSRIDADSHILQVVETRIPFEDIADIRGEFSETDQ